MIIKSVDIEKFRAFENVSFDLGKRITAIAGRNATQKTTVLGMIGQPFTISPNHPMHGCKTIDGYNFRSQFKEKFKISPEHDIIGDHKWKINFHNGVTDLSYYSVESIARKQGDKTPTLRFWNSESRDRGAGYIQLPVYFLSLGRLFPIGESSKTNTVSISLSPDELEYCISNYRSILSIQSMQGSPSVGLEKGTASKTFAGINDDIHDIFTNSAGEGNITRIILAILSFKRLQEQYPNDYKGGILLIDELDATLYGFSQQKLVDYLYNASGKYKIQIIFTTHSPVILKAVNKFQRLERQRFGINRPTYAYDSSIVYLTPQYDAEGKRTIVPKNISTSDELSNIINDINLSLPTGGNKVKIYCEDSRAVSFVRFLLSHFISANIDLFMNFVDIDLGWTNYIQLAGKKVPEFRNNVIILDGDVLINPEYKDAKKRIVNESGNFLFLPLVIEKDIFSLLKDHSAYSRFQLQCTNAASLSYDICFNSWPLEASSYNTNEFKHWYEQIVSALGSQEQLFDFWLSEREDEASNFIENFVKTFNTIAEKNDADSLPTNEDFD